MNLHCALLFEREANKTRKLPFAFIHVIEIADIFTFGEVKAVGCLPLVFCKNIFLKTLKKN